MIPAERKSRSAARTPAKRSSCSTTAISMMTTTGRTSIRGSRPSAPSVASSHGHDHLVAGRDTMPQFALAYRQMDVSGFEWRAGEAGTPPRRPAHKEPMIKAKAVRLAAGLALALGGAAAPARAQFMYPVIIVPPPPGQNLVLPPKPKPPAPSPDASAQSPATPNTPAPGQCYYQGRTRVCP